MGLNLDHRDDHTWVALELTRQGELKIIDGTLASTLRRDLLVGPDFPVFLPAHSYLKSGKSVTLFLMEGYAFVATGLEDTMYFALERKPYVERVMSKPTGPNKLRTLHTLPNREIEQLRVKLREMITVDLQVNDWVKVIEGPYSTLEGRVLGLDNSNAFVKIELKSLKTIATISRIFLEVVPKAKK